MNSSTARPSHSINFEFICIGVFDIDFMAKSDEFIQLTKVALTGILEQRSECIFVSRASLER